MQAKRIMLFLLFALSLAPALEAGVERIDLQVLGMT
jgi:hypothetical protein